MKIYEEISDTSIIKIQPNYSYELSEFKKEFKTTR